MCPVSMVYPSGAARIARVEAVVPPAPTTFSMTIGCPRVRDICSAMMREMTSVGPPAANGTISVIGRRGKSACADAGLAARPDSTPKATPIPAMAAKVRDKTLLMVINPLGVEILVVDSLRLFGYFAGKKQPPRGRACCPRGGNVVAAAVEKGLALLDEDLLAPLAHHRQHRKDEQDNGDAKQRARD